MRWISRVKWIAAAAMVTLLFAAVPVVYGGLKWTGIDPQVRAYGHRVNVTIAVPPDQWCSLEGPIELEFLAHKDAHAAIEFESFDKDGTKCGASTSSNIVEKKGNKLRGKMDVVILVSAGRSRFPVEAQVSVDGIETLHCSGRANRELRCGPVDFDSEGDHSDDSHRNGH